MYIECLRGVHQMIWHWLSWSIFANTSKHTTIRLWFKQDSGVCDQYIDFMLSCAYFSEPVTFVLIHKCNRNITWTFNWIFENCKSWIEIGILRKLVSAMRRKNVKVIATYHSSDFLHPGLWGEKAELWDKKNKLIIWILKNEKKKKKNIFISKFVSCNYEFLSQLCLFFTMLGFSHNFVLFA